MVYRDGLKVIEIISVLFSSMVFQLALRFVIISRDERGYGSVNNCC